MAVEMYCRQCKKKLTKYEQWERKYKSPIAACKKCGTEYLDPRCHELAVEGIPEGEFKATSDIILFIVGALVIWRGWYLLGMHMLGTPDYMQWMVPAVVMLLGLAMAIASIVDAIRILTGLKRRKFEKLLQESQARMQDEEYVQKLRDFGYRSGMNYGK